MGVKKLPSFSQWKQIFKVLKKKEKITLSIFLILALLSFIFLITSFYLNYTKAVPTLGGKYIEGIVGQPRFINPVYGETNDVDRALIDLTFSGLMTYDNKGELVPDLAETYTISNDGKNYDFTLKDNIFWHDGKPLTTDDIIFTIRTIQNSDYKSPLRANWIDVDVQKISDKSLRLILRNPYNSFLENCTLKIIPKHIWQDISPENFALSSYNLQPIGSGPFKFVSLNQTNSGFIKTLNLQSNRKYYNHPSFVSDISFQFFEQKNDLTKAANAKQLDGFTLSSFDNNEAATEKEIRQGWGSEKFSVYSFSLPRYFAVFFNNQKSSISSDKNLREALVYATNKNELVQKISSETKININKVDSPILPDFYGYQTTSLVYGFDIEKANVLLDKSGFKKNSQGQREKSTSKTPAFQFKSYLKIGSTGAEVTQLQSCLARLDQSFNVILQNEIPGKYTSITDKAVAEFQKNYLPGSNPTGETGTSTRKKLNELCISSSENNQQFKITLTTVNQPQLMMAANLLKNYWEALGISVQINALSLTDLKPIIKARSYDALLYGQALGAEPDLYPFWYSSQKIDPGLNLSAYENKTVDQLLKDARETLDPSIKEKKYEQLQDIVIKDSPALFLYNPNYVYWVSNSIKGIDTEKIIDPSGRFSNITNWYIKTKRVFK